MNPNWDLSYLYKGFDDPAFLADLKRFPEEIKVEQAILDGSDDPQTKLEKLTDQQEVLGALSDRLSSFCSLTQAVDANNADATKYLNVLDVIFNDSRIVSSAVTRYIGSLPNLEDLIAASPKLQKVAFHLRESAENAHHTIPEAVEPWILGDEPVRRQRVQPAARQAGFHPHGELPRAGDSAVRRAWACVRRGCLRP